MPVVQAGSCLNCNLRCDIRRQNSRPVKDLGRKKLDHQAEDRVNQKIGQRQQNRAQIHEE